MQEKITEIRKAFRNSKEYLLSHHTEKQKHRCYTIRRTNICARCTGIYPGIAAGLFLNLSQPIAALAALPAAVTVEKFGESRDKTYSNPFKTFTGLLLGAAYGIGLKELFTGAAAPAAGIGATYALIGFYFLKDTEANFKVQ